MSDLEQQKAMIRDRVRARRAELDVQWVEETSERIQKAVMELAPFAQADVVACYMALPYEVQTSLLIETCWSRVRRVCVPCFDQARDAYAWAWLAQGDETRMGHWRVPELQDVRWAHGCAPDLIIAPAVALDRAGGRLGHGGGHYDALMSHGEATKIALAFDFQLVDEIPMGPADVRVDLVITESGVHEVSQDVE